MKYPANPRSSRKLLAATTACLAALAATTHADPPSALGPLPGEMMANPATPTDLLHRPYLTGDPGNLRSELAAKGVTFDLQYVNDYFAIPQGSTIRGRDDDWGRVRFTMDVDFGKLSGIDGLSFHITGLNQNGGNAGNNIGSAANPSSLVSAQTSRLDSYWLQQKLFNGILVLKIGQMAQQDFYGVQEYGGSYLMEPLGYAYGNLFGSVHATFDPASKPGAEIQIHPYGGFYLKSMYQKGQSNPYGDQDHHGFGFDTGGPGVLASEIGYRQDDPSQWPVYNPGTSSKDGKDGKDGKPATAGSDYKAGPRWFWDGSLPEVYKLGLYWNFGDFVDIRNQYTIHDNYLIYASINQGIFRESHYGPGYFRGLDAFIGGNFTPGNVTSQTGQITGGLRYTGLIPTRDKDTLAFGVTHTVFSSDVNTPDSLLIEGDFTSETAVELNYACQVTGWLLIQPTFQYYFNTGGNGLRENAALLGFRSKVVF